MPFWVYSSGSPPWWTSPQTTAATSATTAYVQWLQQPTSSATTTAYTASNGSNYAMLAPVRRSWRAWYTATDSSEWRPLDPPPPVEQQPPDPIDRQRAAEAVVQRARIQASERRQAEDRSRELLLAHLTEEQRSMFERSDWFIVEGGQSKQRYRIRNNRSLVANVDVLAAGLGDSVAYRLCAHCRVGQVPIYDQLLAQKVMLELDEAHFLRVANRH